MKKYVKPTLYFENFELTEAIASCGEKLNSRTIECVMTKHGVPEDVAKLWWDGLIDDYCYTNGAEKGYRVFLAS